MLLRDSISNLLGSALHRAVCWLKSAWQSRKHPTVGFACSAHVLLVSPLPQIYKAERSAEPLRVYNLRYDDSAETDQFSTGLSRERRALESLIADKAHMVLPANPDPTQVRYVVMNHVQTSNESQASGMLMNG